MIQIHLGFIVIPSVIGSILGAYLAPGPFFLIVSGMGCSYYLNSRKKNVTESEIAKETIFRSLILILIDFSVLLFASILWPSVYSFYLNFGIIQAIAFAYIINIPMVIIPKWPRIILLGMIALNVVLQLICLLSPGYSGAIEPLSYLLFFQVGFAAISVINGLETVGKTISAICTSLAVFSLSLCILALLGVQLNASAMDENRSSLPFLIVICLGIIIIALLSKYIYLVMKSKSSLLAPIESLGRISLTIFFSHMAMIYLIVMLVDMIGGAASIPSSQPALALPLLVLFMFLFFILEKYWKRWNYFGGPEWFIRKGADYIMKLI